MAYTSFMPVILHDKRYLLGVAMIAGGAALLSTAGVILRHIEAATGWQILFYRGFAFVVTLLCMIVVRNGGRIMQPFLDIGKNGLLIATFFATASVCYVFAMLLTTIANAVFIIGASPIFVAVVAWLVLGERLSWVTMLAIVVAFGGVVLMFVDGYTGGRMLGNLIALGVVAGFTGMVVVLRKSKTIDMLPATCLGGVMVCIVAAFMTQGFVISGHDLLLALLLGSAQFGMGFALITLGTRYVPAGEVALLALIESVLAPIWAWIWADEVPSALSLTASGVILSAVIVLGVSGVRETRRV